MGYREVTGSLVREPPGNVTPCRKDIDRLLPVIGDLPFEG